MNSLRPHLSSVDEALMLDSHVLRDRGCVHPCPSLLTFKAEMRMEWESLENMAGWTYQ
jgi:hypothetical protein